MLQITIPASELWDEVKQEFVNTKYQTLSLEHSLVSLSKWESKWCKPFIKPDNKTTEEILDYIRCMTLTQNIDSEIYKCIPDDILSQVNTYIEAPMTATTFSSLSKGGTSNRETITNEIIYQCMIAYNIPFECQKWHLNRLITLIKVCELKNQPEKKMSRSEIISRNTELNAARKKRLKTKG
jgi:hypothetical protein